MSAVRPRPKIFHCSTKPLARSSGCSGISLRRLPSRRAAGLDHDYTRRSGILHTELTLPEAAGQWSRAELWNAAEKAEKRKDSRTAREWEIPLPDELGEAERRGLAVIPSSRRRGPVASTGRPHAAVTLFLRAPARR
jgi:hypothetical protein